VAELSHNPTPALYRSPLPFSPDPSPALALYCSDSRFDEHSAKFITDHLGHAAFDLFVVPGGAAWLVWDWRDFSTQRIAREQVAFLVEAHQVKRVVLIAHEDCGFYRKHTPSCPRQRGKTGNSKTCALPCASCTRWPRTSPSTHISPASRKARWCSSRCPDRLGEAEFVEPMMRLIVDGGRHARESCGSCPGSRPSSTVSSRSTFA